MQLTPISEAAAHVAHPIKLAGLETVTQVGLTWATLHTVCYSSAVLSIVVFRGRPTAGDPSALVPLRSSTKSRLHLRLLRALQCDSTRSLPLFPSWQPIDLV